MTSATKIEWVRGDDGKPGLSWNALRAERWTPDPNGPGLKKRSANHCEHVNEACRWCYSERGNARLGGLPFKPGHRADYTFVLDQQKLFAPLRVRTPKRIFVESTSDLFGEWWPIEFVHKSYAVMALCPQHTFINLSKRPKRRRDYLALSGERGTLPDAVFHAALAILRERHEVDIRHVSWDLPGWPLRNVIEGTSVSNQAEAGEFIPELLATNAAVRAVSCEPLLGPIDLEPWLPWPDGDQEVKGKSWGCIECDDRCDGCPNEKAVYKCTEGPFDPEALAPAWIHEARQTLDWVIVGGESGPNARPMNPQWARDIRDQCLTSGVPFFHKQNGEFASVSEVEGEGRHHYFEDGRTVRRVGKKAAGRLLDGVEHNEWPQVQP